MKIKKVFIASPLFNSAERKLNEEIAEMLEKAGYETFLPQRDGFLYADIIKKLQEKNQI